MRRYHLSNRSIAWEHPRACATSRVSTRDQTNKLDFGSKIRAYLESDNQSTQTVVADGSASTSCRVILTEIMAARTALANQFQSTAAALCCRLGIRSFRGYDPVWAVNPSTSCCVQFSNNGLGRMTAVCLSLIFPTLF
jgi:hypothetical protein